MLGSFGESALVEWLLWQRVVDRVVRTWHDIHMCTTLYSEGEGRKEREGGKEGEESSHMSAALKSEWSGLLKRPSIYIMYVRWTSGTNHHIQKVLENFC